MKKGIYVNNLILNNITPAIVMFTSITANSATIIDHIFTILAVAKVTLWIYNENFRGFIRTPKNRPPGYGLYRSRAIR